MVIHVDKGTHSLHVAVPDKYRALAMEQGMPEAAMILRALTKNYAGKMSNREASAALEAGLKECLRLTEAEQLDLGAMRQKLYAMHDVVKALVIWEG